MSKKYCNLMMSIASLSTKNSIMKKLSLIIAGLATAIVLMASITDSDKQLEMELQGVWELQHQTFYENNLVTDTLYNMNGYRQVKMYSKGKVMWSRYDPGDNNDWFGYGTYTIEDGMLKEQLEYASLEMMKIVDTTEVFEFSLVVGKNAYSQIALDADGNPEYAENYTKIE